MMVTVDTSVWIDFFKGRTTPPTQQLERILIDATQEIVVLDLVLFEILMGVKDEREYQLVSGTLSPFVVPSAGGKDVAMSAAKIYRQLRQKGLTVRSSVDLLIAAWCLINASELLHNDRDFDAIASHFPLQIRNA
jgi:predicted nucleic acid-binding protein